MPVTYTDSKSLLVSFITQLAIAGGLIAAFCVLRPNNKAIYEPRLKYASEKKRPQPLPQHLLGWLSVFHVQDEKHVGKIGI
jgi:Late exocytosis, associated with Golgi transport